MGGFGGGAFIFNQIQTAIVNPSNVSVNPESGYFEDPELLARVPYLMLYLGAVYFTLSFLAGCLMQAPPATCLDDEDCEASEGYKINEGVDMEVKKADINDVIIEEEKDEDVKNISEVKEAFKSRYFYLLWITRFSVVLITQVLAGFYKSFGITFI